MRTPLSISLLALVAASSAVAQDAPVAGAVFEELNGSFNMLSYDLAGLPNGIRPKPGKNNALIGAQAASFQIVDVQDDFLLHENLYAADRHEFRTAQSTSGLNTMSSFPMQDFRRIRWAKCCGIECNVPKGFTFKRLMIDPSGAYVDLYNMDAYDSVDSPCLQARNENLEQLSGFIRDNSPGMPVIVTGATNMLYTNQGDNIRRLLEENQLVDVWVDLVRKGNVPAAGSPALTCDKTNPIPECEVVDKIFFRGSTRFGLKATAYENVFKLFVDGNGQNLSERFPISSNFAYTVFPDFQKSDEQGGSGGIPFDDSNQLPLDSSAIKVASLTLRGAKRVDKISLTINDGTQKTFEHGGNGGTPITMNLAANEHIVSATACHGGKDRIVYVEFVTNLNSRVSTGRRNDSSKTFTAPAGFQIVGFTGRSGDEVDKLGVIFGRL